MPWGGAEGWASIHPQEVTFSRQVHGQDWLCVSGQVLVCGCRVSPAPSQPPSPGRMTSTVVTLHTRLGTSSGPLCAAEACSLKKRSLLCQAASESSQGCNCLEQCPRQVAPSVSALGPQLCFLGSATDDVMAGLQWALYLRFAADLWESVREHSSMCALLETVVVPCLRFCEVVLWSDHLRPVGSGAADLCQAAMASCLRVSGKRKQTRAHSCFP